MNARTRPTSFPRRPFALDLRDLAGAFRATYVSDAVGFRFIAMLFFSASRMSRLVCCGCCRAPGTSATGLPRLERRSAISPLENFGHLTDFDIILLHVLAGRILAASGELTMAAGQPCQRCWVDRRSRRSRAEEIRYRLRPR